MPDIVLFTPQELTSSGEIGPPPIEQFALRFLAQGDSWFSIGAMPPWLTTNLFDRLSLNVSSCAVNCAAPGLKLRRMTDSTHARNFLNLLNGKVARKWSGLLLSGGGNDVIEATQSPPQTAADKRLLATSGEWGDASLGGERYVSVDGWRTFSHHLIAVFEELIAERDKAGSLNQGIPIFLHTYDLATPRNASAGGGQGPWLFPAVRQFGIPEADWPAVGHTLLRKLAALLQQIAADPRMPNLVLIDILGTLQPAATSDNHATLHWHNEIHPSKSGYRALADRWELALSRHYSL